jgi:hypothetical protein
MHSLLKSAVLGAGLLAGVAATAYAQSVSNLPPTNPAAAPTATPTAPAPSTAKIYPDPGSSNNWTQQNYQPTQNDNDPTRHPYSKPHFGPAADD